LETIDGYEMSLFKDEHALARYWRDKLKGVYPKVYVNINPASHRFYDYWKEWWAGISSPPAQPQIDLVIVNVHALLAVELKYFRMIDYKGTKRVNYPFYVGIEEALSLLRFGFECISLWQCFDREVPNDIISRYEPAVSSLINTIEIPINYESFFLDEYQNKIHAYPIRGGKPFWFETTDTGKRAIMLPSPHGVVNPLKDKAEAKKMLDFLRSVLRIPRE
jgi:hypothetical protein